MQHSLFSRSLSLIFTIPGAFLFLVFDILLIIFIFEINLSQYSKIHIPNISTNNNFEIFKQYFFKDFKYSKSISLIIKIVFNFSLLFVFWVFHIIMSNRNFKIFMEKIFFYQSVERGLFTLCNFFIF